MKKIYKKGHKLLLWGLVEHSGWECTGRLSSRRGLVSRPLLRHFGQNLEHTDTSNTGYVILLFGLNDRIYVNHLPRLIVNSLNVGWRWWWWWRWPLSSAMLNLCMILLVGIYKHASKDNCSYFIFSVLYKVTFLPFFHTVKFLVLSLGC